MGWRWESEKDRNERLSSFMFSVYPSHLHAFISVEMSMTHNVLNDGV